MSYRGNDSRGCGRGGPPGRGGYQGSPNGLGGGYPSRGRGSSGDRGRGGFDQHGIHRPDPVNVDSRLQDASQDELVTAMKRLTVQPYDLPPKPGFGTAGKQINLRSNFFAISVSKGAVHEYNLAIAPAPVIRRVKRRIFQLAEASPEWTSYGLNGAVAHDHSAKLIAAKPLPQPLSIRVQFYNEGENGPTARSREYTLSITYIQEIDLEGLKNHVSGDLRYRNLDISSRLAALQIILAAHANRSGGGIKHGRSCFFFRSAMAPFDLGGGLEAWKGFRSSVRPAHKQLMVNVNVCTAAFYKEGNLAAAINAFRNASVGACASSFVRGVRVKTHLGRERIIKTTFNLNARQHRFSDEFGAVVTVEEYFGRKYHITLQYPEMELVDVGTLRNRILVPAETCIILPNQPFCGKLTEEHTARMILAAATPPNMNVAIIEGQGLNSLGFRHGASLQLGAFNINIKDKMTVIPARILEKPRVQYAGSIVNMDDKASWNMRGVRFKTGAEIKNLAVILIKDGNDRDEFQSAADPELKTVVRGFLKMCEMNGMRVQKTDPPVVEVRLPPQSHGDPVRGQVIVTLDRRVREGLKAPPGIFLVLLSNGDKHVYAQIKALFDVRLGIPTVCVHSAKIRKERGQLQYFANVALKFNMKLGGVNHVLEESTMRMMKAEPTMLVGIDVTHPGPGSVRGTPSVAAVVASTDIEFAQFPGSLRIQESGRVSDLTDMMVERLELFQARNKNILPSRIIVYRDGISESQFSMVVANEVPQIKQSFREFDTAEGAYKPKLTIVICGKGRHTRFYPTKDEDAGMEKNPVPGTVVDRGVTSIYQFDFFLQAHAGLEGSTKPIHYYVVYDDIGFTQDQFQGLTNDVSYLFARSTKAVSLASPAYYAALACKRGRCYLHPLFQGVSRGNINDEAFMEEARRMWAGGVNDRLKDTMFYL